MSSIESVVPDSSDGDFPAELWKELTISLRAVEPVFRDLAVRNRLRLLSSARWPELRLQRRSGVTASELRLSLDPVSRTSPERPMNWIVELARFPRFAWLPWRRSEVDRLMAIGDQELRAHGIREDSLFDAVRALVRG